MQVRRATITAMARGWLMLAGLLLLVFAGLSAHAAIRAMRSHPMVIAAVPPPATGYEAEEHFPGAAAMFAVADQAPAAPRETAAPAAGVTGTIALPDLPLPVAALRDTGTGVVAARPFTTAGASAIDRGRALECLTAAIYYEAASEPDAGQQAVAQVILNRVRHPAFPATVCGVVYQGSDHAGCQFSFACDGAMRRVPAHAAWARAVRVAAMALAGRVFAPVGLATHYHTYAVTPVWNRSLVMTDVVGAHFFHRWKGAWGTAAAFRQVYRGGEPLPGPHVAPPADPAPLVIALAAPVLPDGATAAHPDHRAPPQDRAAAIALAAPVDTLPPAAAVLPQWRDSGTPLR